MNQHQLEECSMRLLPDDVLAEVFRRVVSPRDLAASRCVCTAWRELIDARRLVRSDLLPHKLAGLLINYNELPLPDLFRRPSSSISTGSFRFSRGHHCYNTHRTHVRDHCNGVILLYGGLLNPATGWWVPLPKFPTPRMGIGRDFYFHDDMHLVFDPAVSPGVLDPSGFARLVRWSGDGSVGVGVATDGQRFECLGADVSPLSSTVVFALGFADTDSLS